MLRTETPNPEHEQLDRYATVDIAAALIADQQGAAMAVMAVHRDLARAVDAAVPRIAAGGRLFYVGAGTSGRLGVLDSAELHPTFNWPRERAIGILAGGKGAVFDAAEGAEDNLGNGAADLSAHGVGANDVVLLLAASGGTPYVMGALQAARSAGALTIGFANNPDAALTRAAEIGITLDTGPEVISGSTRLKAGTAQKIALNTFSSTLMVCLNKVYGNLMVDVRPTNVKLLARTVALTRHATGVSQEVASAALAACEHNVKVAIVMLRRDLDAPAALRLLDEHGGSVRAALGEAGPLDPK